MLFNLLSKCLNKSILIITTLDNFEKFLRIYLSEIKIYLSKNYHVVK